MAELDDPGIEPFDERSYSSGRASCMLALLGCELGPAHINDDFIQAAALRADAGSAADGWVAELGIGSVASRIMPPGIYTLRTSGAATAPADGPNDTAAPGLPQAAAPRGFVAGTRILTARGEVAVEALTENDFVFSIRSCSLVPIRSVATCDVNLHDQADPEAVNPVHIRADAFGPGRPKRDLVLAPHQAIHVEGKLTAVRFLLNGATIRQERRDDVRYYHVALESHDVMLAEGLAAESRLATADVSPFVDACSEERAALRQTLLDRAIALGHVLTDDAGLRLLVGEQAVRPMAVPGGVRFLLPYGSGLARIVSRSFIPRQVHAAHADGRQLGVGVVGIRLDDRVVPLDDSSLSSGWNEPEPALRWTAGDAWLDTSSARTLTLMLLDGASAYWLM